MIDWHQPGEQSIHGHEKAWNSLIYHEIAFYKIYRPTVNRNFSFYNEHWTTTQDWKVYFQAHQNKKYWFLFFEWKWKHVVDSDVFTDLKFLL